MSILNCLHTQLLTYASVRDIIEERQEKSRQARLELRSEQANERRREQEYAGARWKLKRDVKESKRDVTTELEDLARDADRSRAAHLAKIKKLTKAEMEHHNYLGLDRAYRRYVRLNSVPGLFVEFEERNAGVCLDKPVEQNPDLVGAGRADTLKHIRKIYEEMNSSDKENSPEKKRTKVNGQISATKVGVNPDLLVCTADPATCGVHSANTENEQPTSFLYCREQFEQLLNGLNKRGIRER